MKPFRAAGGDVVARLDPAEAGIVGLLLDQLEQLLAADADDVAGDPVLARLLPDGHRGDPELAADYRELTESSLRSGKADDLAIDARHAARRRRRGPAGPRPGRRLAAHAPTTCGWRWAPGWTSPRTPSRRTTSPTSEDQQLAVYYWLTALQGSLVDALVAGRAGRR